LIKLFETKISPIKDIFSRDRSEGLIWALINENSAKKKMKIIQGFKGDQLHNGF